MDFRKNQKGMNLITLVITIVVILILAAISITLNDGTLDEAMSAKFKQEISDVKKSVETVKLINAKEGLDERTLNKNFKKVIVENPPSNFISFDQDKFTGYLVDLKVIDYDKLKTGQEYKKFNSGDTVTFDKDDVYIYDSAGSVYYLKGMMLEDGQTYYTAEEKKSNGPRIVCENTTGGTIVINVTPTNGGEITSVTVGRANCN